MFEENKKLNVVSQLFGRQKLKKNIYFYQFFMKGVMTEISLFACKDALIQIFSFLDRRSLAKTARVCKIFRDVIFSSSSLWPSSETLEAMRRLGMSFSFQKLPDHLCRIKAFECYRLEHLLQTVQCTELLQGLVLYKRGFSFNKNPKVELIKDIHFDSQHRRLIVVWPKRVEWRDPDTFCVLNSMKISKPWNQFKTGYAQIEKLGITEIFSAFENPYYKTRCSFFEEPFLVIAGVSHNRPKSKVINLTTQEKFTFDAELLDLNNGTAIFLHASDLVEISIYDLNKKVYFAHHSLPEILRKTLSYQYWRTAKHIWVHCVLTPNSASKVAPSFMKIVRKTHAMTHCILNTEHFKGRRPPSLYEFSYITEGEDGTLFICRRGVSAHKTQFRYLLEIYTVNGYFLGTLFETQHVLTHFSSQNQRLLFVEQTEKVSILWVFNLETYKLNHLMNMEDRLISLTHFGNYLLIGSTRFEGSDESEEIASTLRIWDLIAAQEINSIRHRGLGFSQLAFTGHTLVGVQHIRDVPSKQTGMMREREHYTSILWKFQREAYSAI